MRNLIVGLLIAGGLMAQQFGSKAEGTERVPTGPQPGVIDCKTYSGRWVVAFRDAQTDLKWLPGGVLAQPFDTKEVQMSKKFLPYARMIECDVSIVNERY